MAELLDGKRIADEILGEVRSELLATEAAGRRPPGLAVVLVGGDPASLVYVGLKVKKCAEIGFHSERYDMPESTTTEELLELIARLNAKHEIDGILVQLPLPKHIATARVLEAIDPRKDADGFHPENAGRLLQGKPAPVPCTPAGILELLRREGVTLRGTRAVVVGRSDIVGKPMALLLLQNDATVTVAHSKTRDLPALCREADLLVAAIGRPGFVTGDFVKEGAVVVDVGINRVTTRADLERFFPGDAKRLAAFEKNGSTLVGDCDPATAFPRASRYTPVPGGVGPLTIAHLLLNTLRLCEARRG